ncbi:MAG: hypothetical protein ABIW85_04140 [Variovorax sp.]
MLPEGLATSDGCKVPSFGVCPFGAAGGNENHSVAYGSSSACFRSNFVSYFLDLRLRHALFKNVGHESGLFWSVTACIGCDAGVPMDARYDKTFASRY